MRRFFAFVVVEPHRPLKLISCVQKQHVRLLSPDLRHFGEHPGDPREARVRAFVAFGRVLAGLLDASVDVVGVEQSQLEAGRSAPRVQAEKETEQSAQGAGAPTWSHAAAVRKSALVSQERNEWRRRGFIQDSEEGLPNFPFQIYTGNFMTTKQNFCTTEKKD